MTTRIPLRCRCGQVRGHADVGPDVGQRIVCYCDDCQAFLHFLGREDALDAHGGTDIYQLWPAQMHLTEGLEHVRCVRLGPKGMYRFYAGCCRTPIGNTPPTSKSPFIGVPAPFMDHETTARSRDAVLGLPTAGYFARFAIGGVPAGADSKVSLRNIVRSVRFLARGVLRGRNHPSPFFDPRSGEPIAQPEVLSADERERLAHAAESVRG